MISLAAYEVVVYQVVKDGSALLENFSNLTPYQNIRCDLICKLKLD